MDRMTPQEIIKIVQAHIDGKTIQYTPVEEKEDWVTLHIPPGWNFDGFAYRVKPEPRVRYMAEDNTGWLSCVSEPTMDKAMSGKSKEQWPRVVKFIEVLDNEE